MSGVGSAVGSAPLVGSGRLDHVVITGPDLAELVAWFAERTGVTAVPGGTHPRGTANALVALTVGGVRGRRYLELIAPWPGAAAPRVHTYAVRPPDLDACVALARGRGHDPGEPADLSRRTPDGTVLRWRLARTDRRPDVPFLIDWGDTPHPGLADLPAVELLQWQRIEPDPGPTRAAITALGLDPAEVAELITGGPPRYRLVVAGPDGTPREL